MSKISHFISVDKEFFEMKKIKNINDLIEIEMSGSRGLQSLLAAVFYGCSSCLLMVLNKAVLTSYNFPSFQALAVGTFDKN